MKKQKNLMISLLAMVLASANVSMASPVDALSEQEAASIMQTIFTQDEIDDLCRMKYEMDGQEQDFDSEKNRRFDQVIDIGCGRIINATWNMG